MIWPVGYIVTFNDFNLISSPWKPISKLGDKVNWYLFDDDNLNLDIDIYDKGASLQHMQKSTKADLPDINFFVPIKHSLAHNKSSSLLILGLFNISQFHDPPSCRFFQ